MPFIAPLIPILTAIGTGLSIYQGVKGLTSGGSSGQQTITQGATPSQTASAAPQGLSQAQKALATTTAANVQSQTSGAATPDYLQSILSTAFGPSAANQTGPGATGDIQGIVNNAFGLGGGANSGYSGSVSPTAVPGASGTPPTSAGDTPDYLKQFLSSTGIGNGGGTPSTDLAGSLLQQNFSGFGG